jgi:glycosyltransferase involved in cell wall biosynthesis
LDELVVVTPHLVEFFASVAPQLKVRLIPSLLPIAIGWSQPNSPIKPDGDRHVLSLGAFIPSYGFHDVIAAVEGIRRETNENIRLTLVAGSFAMDDRYRQRLLANRHWIEVLDDVPHDKQPAVYRSADVFVRAFAHESYGLSRIEAIWNGLPVIATDIGETRGMRTYQFGDVAQLTEHLRELLAARVDLNADHWARIYTNEAENNLAAWLKVITGGSDA